MTLDLRIPDELAERYRAPLCVVITTVAARHAGGALRTAFGDRVFLMDDPSPWDSGLAILVISADDIAGGPHREALLRFATESVGRPVMIGGAHTRDVLLEAINTWRVTAVVPADAPDPVVVEAVRRAHSALEAELALTRAAGDCRAENARLARAVRELRTAQENLLHAERMQTLSRIMGGLIRTMRGYQQRFDAIEAVLRRRAKEPELAGLLEEAFEGFRSVSVLLDEFGAYADSRAPTYDFRDEDLDALVARVSTFCRFDRLARERQVRVRLEARCTVRADRYRLYQVLLNLVRNACQATERGQRIELRTSRTPEWAIIEVEDEGGGIPPQVAESIFQPFVTTKGEAGLGLGLTMCRNLIARHGGTIGFTSHPGEGACFSIRLPLAPGTPLDAGRS